VLNNLQTINDEIIKTTKLEDNLPIGEAPSEKKQEDLRTAEVPSLIIKENKELGLINEIENYVGWITLNNTQINYPIVKTDNNDFYLDHGYDLEPNIAGTIFMDRRNLGNAFDDHTIVYGHHMKNGSMFTDLNLYLEENFFYKHQIITFRDLYQTYEYQIFSAYYVSADNFILEYDINNTTAEDMISRSLYPTNYQYFPGDRILTLSTCNYILNNGRMIIHAVQIK
jgi:sortase B